ncbi:MAG: hypothetical protein EBU90_21245 [Proteobacteria bacterium]|nr:hypothetical protein [Pseudomonadota bacterium]NBP16062.1 hypothetical protein [bacterium]
MQEKYITINRNAIRLKIKQLLKKSIAEGNPHIVEFILNKVMDDTRSTEAFFDAVVGIDKEHYYDIGSVVRVNFAKVKNWSNKAAITTMLENPDSYGIDIETDTIKCIIAEQYWYSHRPKYSIVYRMFKDEKIQEQKLDISEDDIYKENE